MIAFLLALACAEPEAPEYVPTAADVLVGWYMVDEPEPTDSEGGGGYGECWYLVVGFAGRMTITIEAHGEDPGINGENGEDGISYEYEEHLLYGPYNPVVVSDEDPMVIDIQSDPPEWNPGLAPGGGEWNFEPGSVAGGWWITYENPDADVPEFGLLPGCPVEPDWAVDLGVTPETYQPT